MRTLIIPCAGQSSRFNTELPKWLLDHPTGNTMVYEAIQGLPLNTFDSIIVVALKRHLTNNLIERLYREFSNFEFTLLLLDNDTESASDTVSQCITLLDLDGSIFIKDSDDYFYVENVNPNEICTYSLLDSDDIIAENKSYVKIDKNKKVIDIAEKKIISNDFCCGLYSFHDAKEFVMVYESMNQTKETYISHVIYEMLNEWGNEFHSKPVKSYVDWGTQDDWIKFKKNYGK